jgi:hypothetical protein
MTSQNGPTAQLSLIETPRAWRLDERTRAVGRAGVAQARAALRDGVRTRAPDPPAASRKRKAA